MQDPLRIDVSSLSACKSRYTKIRNKRFNQLNTGANQKRDYRIILTSYDKPNLAAVLLYYLRHKF